MRLQLLAQANALNAKLCAVSEPAASAAPSLPQIDTKEAATAIDPLISALLPRSDAVITALEFLNPAIVFGQPILAAQPPPQAQTQSAAPSALTPRRRPPPTGAVLAALQAKKQQKKQLKLMMKRSGSKVDMTEIAVQTEVAESSAAGITALDDPASTPTAAASTSASASATSSSAAVTPTQSLPAALHLPATPTHSKTPDSGLAITSLSPAIVPKPPTTPSGSATLGTALKQLVLGSEQLSVLLTRSKQNGVSLHATLCTALLLAQFDRVTHQPPAASGAISASASAAATVAPAASTSASSSADAPNSAADSKSPPASLSVFSSPAASAVESSASSITAPATAAASASSVWLPFDNAATFRGRELAALSRQQLLFAAWAFRVYVPLPVPKPLTATALSFVGVSSSDFWALAKRIHSEVHTRVKCVPALSSLFFFSLLIN